MSVASENLYFSFEFSITALKFCIFPEERKERMADFFEEEAEVSDEDAPASSDEEEEYEEDIGT